MSTTTMTPTFMPARGRYWRTEHDRAYRLRPQVARTCRGSPHGGRELLTPAAWLLHGVALLEAWRVRARSRRALQGLSDAMLKDVGLSRADAWREGRKPFWRP